MPKIKYNIFWLHGIIACFALLHQFFMLAQCDLKYGVTKLMQIDTDLKNPCLTTYMYMLFQILPTIVFFSCVISLLYYIGVMQAVIRVIASVMQITMGTSATESLSCAGNIFIGQVSACTYTYI